jgi:hypothetical protein
MGKEIENSQEWRMIVSRKEEASFYFEYFAFVSSLITETFP